MSQVLKFRAEEEGGQEASKVYPHLGDCGSIVLEAQEWASRCTVCLAFLGPVMACEVANYRLAYRRFYGRDISMQEQFPGPVDRPPDCRYDFARRQQHAVDKTKARFTSKA